MLLLDRAIPANTTKGKPVNIARRLRHRNVCMYACWVDPCPPPIFVSVSTRHSVIVRATPRAASRHGSSARSSDPCINKSTGHIQTHRQRTPPPTLTHTHTTRSNTPNPHTNPPPHTGQRSTVARRRRVPPPTPGWVAAPKPAWNKAAAVNNFKDPQMCVSLAYIRRASARVNPTTVAANAASGAWREDRPSHALCLAGSSIG